MGGHRPEFKIGTKSQPYRRSKTVSALNTAARFERSGGFFAPTSKRPPRAARRSMRIGIRGPLVCIRGVHQSPW
jgi:hypothetical protein